MSLKIEREKIIDVIENAYEVLAFPPGGAPIWDRFLACFIENAIMGLRVFPLDEEVSVLTMLEYTKEQMKNNLKEEGYSETPGERKMEIVGDIAYVKQYFTMNFADKEPVKAVDVFSLVRINGNWKIISVVSDMAKREEV